MLQWNSYIKMQRTTKVVIVGTAGVPGNYGGFETLADNLAKYHKILNADFELIIYCSTENYVERSESYHASKLRYIPLRANGVQSIPYDIWSIVSAVLIEKVDVVLILGVSGAIALPLVRMVSKAKIITNVDGIEWKRGKWNRPAKSFLRLSERIAARYSHVVISDNVGIADHVRSSYEVESEVIAYGGDHVLETLAKDISEYNLPNNYIFMVCRIEKENNIELIVSAFAKYNRTGLVIVGNWSSSSYGKKIKEYFEDYEHIRLIDPIYDLGILRSMRGGARAIVHGHSAGGTNPSLVEAMWFGKPILAFDCIYNRHTTENEALFFSDESSLIECLDDINNKNMELIGKESSVLARKRYSWGVIASRYFDLFEKVKLVT